MGLRRIVDHNTWRISSSAKSFLGSVNESDCDQEVVNPEQFALQYFSGRQRDGDHHGARGRCNSFLLLPLLPCAAGEPSVLQPHGIRDPACNLAEIAGCGMAAAALPCKVGFSFVCITDQDTWRFTPGGWRSTLFLNGFDDAAHIS